MIKNIALVFSILLLSMFLVISAYVLKNDDICCKYELCRQFTNICIEDSKGEGEKESGEVLSEKGERIYFKNLKSGDTLTVLDEIKGSVPSSWIFEGSFPVRVVNRQGDTVADLSALADEEYMREGYVPFTLDLSLFPINLDEEGVVVFQFEKDNPSGLDENDDSARVTVTLKPVIKEKTISFKVFFPNSILSEMEDCSLVFPVVRVVPYTTAVGRASLEELFKGLVGVEASEGYFTNIPYGVKILSLDIREGVAYVDLSKE